MKDKLIKIIASCCYIGYIPLGGGTVASFAGIFLYLLIASSFVVYLVTLTSLIIIGFLVSRKAERLFGGDDSPKIVIDELAATLIVFFQVPPTFKLMAIGFIVFRLLDVIKPYPANKVEEAHSKASVMGDDLIVAIYTNIILQIIIFIPRLLRL